MGVAVGRPTLLLPLFILTYLYFSPLIYFPPKALKICALEHVVQRHENKEKTPGRVNVIAILYH